MTRPLEPYADCQRGRPQFRVMIEPDCERSGCATHELHIELEVFASALVRRLERKFGHLTAVDQLSFEANEGEALGLLGPNGAGKTNTIRMLAHLISLTGITEEYEEWGTAPFWLVVVRPPGFGPGSLALFP